MKYHLVRIDPFRAARMAAVMYLLLGLAVLPFVFFALVVAPTQLGFSAGMVLLTPFLLSGIGYASTAIGCFFYNRLAARLGGFEMDLDHQEHG